MTDEVEKIKRKLELYFGLTINENAARFRVDLIESLVRAIVREEMKPKPLNNQQAAIIDSAAAEYRAHGSQGQG